MVDFGLTDTQRSLVLDAERRAGKLVQGSDGQGLMARAQWRLWGSEGWLGTCLSTENGGGGHGALSTVLAFEALGKAGVDRGRLFAVGAHLFGCTMAVANYGTSQQRADWCPQLASGDAVGALAFTEASGGSDLKACETEITEDKDGLCLSGQKSFVSNGAQADLFIVLAKSPAQSAPFNLSMLLVPSTTPGLEICPIEGGRGLSATSPAKIIFNNCRLPTDAVLGARGGGVGVLIGTMRWERSCILAGFLGALDRDIGRVTAYLKEKRGPAVAPIKHQAVAHSLARIKLRAENARWMLYRGAWALNHDKEQMLLPAMSKLSVSEALVDCTTELLRLIGTFGWVGGLELGDALDDVLGTLSASGTSEVQLNTIAAGFGGV